VKLTQRLLLFATCIVVLSFAGAIWMVIKHGDGTSLIVHDLFVAGITVLVIAWGGAWIAGRLMATALLELRDVARALARGDLSRRPALAAAGEIGDVSAALTGVAEQLGARLTALQNEDALLSALFDSLGEGVLAINRRNQIVEINAAGRRILGISDPLPVPIEHLPRDRALHDALAAALRGATTDALEINFGERTLAITARPLTGGGAVLTLFELTQLRRLEMVRRDFAANVSHELRTPLTVVGGFAETLADGEVSDAERKHFATIILSNTQRMQRIVDELLDLSRIESGGWVPRPATLDVRDVAIDTLADCQAAATAKGVQLATDIALDARTIYADRTALGQVLSNLTENAIRHTSIGTVTVFTHVDVSKGGLWVGVRDTGSGIPAEHLPRIFERFYRADPGRARDVGGTGLGLAIVKHLVEAHGGQVRAESVVGRGTTVSAWFPPQAVVGS
jgi:signal transduction histidine kinase